MHKEKRTRAYRFSGSSPAFPAQWLYGLCRALVSAKSARMCERAVLTNRPSLDLSPIVLKGLESLSGSVGQIRCLPQPEQLHGLRARTEQGREWMMAQNDLVVVGIDVAKDKVDACIRSLSSTADVPEWCGGAAQADCLASQAQGRQGGHGGERRLRAGLGQGAARGRHRGPDRRSRSGCAALPDRPGASPRTMRSMRR